MSRSILTIEASAIYATNAPTLQVLVNGVVYSSAVVTATTGVGADFLSFVIDYPGNYPSSISFRFTDGFGEGGRSIAVENARVNGKLIDRAGDFSSNVALNQNDSVGIIVANTQHLYGREPITAGDLGTASQTGTGSDDIIRGNGNGGNGDVIDAGAGSDRVLGIGSDDAINGGDGDDYLYGGDGNDIIIGGAGRDIVAGGEGDDLLHGQDGDDFVLGEGGNDVLNGGAGNDSLAGGTGDDILYGEAGNDRLIGDAGNDSIYGDAGNDTISGGAGDDYIEGGDDDDSISGGAGVNEIYGGAGNDQILGGSDVDTIDGGAGIDHIFAGAGNDIVNGGSEDDAIFGDGGDDTINGDGGADFINGGAGADTIDGGDGNDIIQGHGLDYFGISAILRSNAGVFYSFETGSFYQLVDAGFNITWTAAQSAAAANTINGVGGHLAVITTQAEHDELVANVYNGGNAFIGGGDITTEGVWEWQYGPEAGLQFWDEGANSALNNAYVNWTAGQPNDSDGGQDYMYILNSNDQWADAFINGGGGFVNIEQYVIEWDGGLFSDDNAADILSGGSGNDWIYGFGGDDTLNGDAGNDFLFGGTGDDTMDGGANNDYLVGATGSDTITGGSGNDVLYAAIVGTVGAQTVISAGGGGPVTQVYFSESFGSDEADFVYADFNDPANVDVDGTYQGGDGDTANGSLQVDIVRNGGTFSNASGLYSTEFFSAGSATNTQVIFSYRHTHANQNDNGEDSSVFFVLNGTLYDQFGGNGFINTALGSGGATDTGWVTVTLDLPDLTANSLNTISFGLYHTGSNGNNEDARVRFDDITVQAEVTTVTLVAQDFTRSSGAFTYADDVFGGTAGADASGSYITTDGDTANGALEILLGKTGGANPSNISGGWVTTIDAVADLQGVTLDFSYRLQRPTDFEANEDTYIYVEVDNVKYGIAPNNYVFTHERTGGNYDSGWVSVTVDIGTLTAGSHTVEIGQFLEGSTTASEVSTLRLDDIVMTGLTGLGGNDATSSGNDSAESNNLDGGAGNDVLYGSAGADYLYGNDGTDQLYSDSQQRYTVADALAEIGGLQYNADTGSFYSYVSGAATAPTAFANAAATNLNGVAGHIVHVTSAAENAYIDTLTGTAATWLGGQDTAVEGEWRWIGGKLDGELFWLGNVGGSAQNGYYENFNANEPNDYVGGEDYMEMQNGGGWNDNGGPHNNGLTRGYVIEWEASEIFSFGATTLNGGAGSDELYGSEGADLFVFDSNSGDAFTNPDTVFNFDSGDGDALDISDILDGLGVNSTNLSSYVDLSEGNGLRVDTSGSGSFGAGTTIATFSGFSAVGDEAAMLANGNLIIA